MFSYSTPTDIYSLGVVFLELLTHKQCNPFMGFTQRALDGSNPITYEQHLDECLKTIPDIYSSDTRDLLKQMLDKVCFFNLSAAVIRDYLALSLQNPNTRITVQEILKNPQAMSSKRLMPSNRCVSTLTALLSELLFRLSFLSFVPATPARSSLS